MKAVRVNGYEFHYIGGPKPYLRMANVHAQPLEHYIGALDGHAQIRKLRDYLTKALKRRKAAK